MSEIKNINYAANGGSREDAIFIRGMKTTEDTIDEQYKILKGRKIAFDKSFERIEAGDSVYFVYYTEKGPVWFNLSKN